jgi:hypothetical protein
MGKKVEKGKQEWDGGYVGEIDVDRVRGSDVQWEGVEFVLYEGSCRNILGMLADGAGPDKLGIWGNGGGRGYAGSEAWTTGFALGDSSGRGRSSVAKRGCSRSGYCAKCCGGRGGGTMGRFGFLG